MSDSQELDVRPHGSTAVGRFALGLLLGLLVVPAGLMVAGLIGDPGLVLLLMVALAVGAALVPPVSGSRVAGVAVGVAATMSVNLHLLALAVADGGF